ncbi:hypothetical protein Tco_0933356 [Tanacetum coccineum]
MNNIVIGGIEYVKNKIIYYMLIKKTRFRSNPTPREQHRDRRDRLREEHNKVREKDRIIDQKQSKKREREEEVDSIKGQTFRTIWSKGVAFISCKPKMRVMIPSEKFWFSFDWDSFDWENIDTL